MKFWAELFVFHTLSFLLHYTVPANLEPAPVLYIYCLYLHNVRVTLELTQSFYNRLCVNWQCCADAFCFVMPFWRDRFSLQISSSQQHHDDISISYVARHQGQCPYFWSLVEYYIRMCVIVFIKLSRVFLSLYLLWCRVYQQNYFSDCTNNINWIFVAYKTVQWIF